MHPEFYRKNAIDVQICLTYSKFQSHKDHFIKLWIVICKSLSKYEIMQKYLQNIALALSYTPKMPFFGSNLPHLPNFWRLAYFFQKVFKSPTFFPEFVSACQKLAKLIILSLRYSHFKILQFDWPRAFWPISQEPGFWQI